MNPGVKAIVILSLSLAIGNNTSAQENPQVENKVTMIEPNRESMIELHESVTAMTPEQMMSYLPGHQTHVPYSWETPGHMRCVRGKGNWETASDEIINTYAQVGNYIHCGVEAQRRMEPKYPDKFYSHAYMNLGKEFSRKEAADRNPEYYVYKKDGTLYLNGRYPYFNFKVPECRAYWLSEARRQIDMEPKSDHVFIDGFAKAVAVSQDNDSFYDYWGGKIGPEYMAEGVDPLLAAARDDFADEVIIAGNIWRPTNIYNFSDDFNPEYLLDYVMKYTHLAYFEAWESGSQNAETVNNSLAHLQKITESGRMIRFNIRGGKPSTRAVPLILDEMRVKAQTAMPDLWEKLDSEERDELAHSYAYFDVKLAYFLIGAGEYSYLQFDNPPRIIEAGTDMWRIKQPFPEYNMPLGRPLERAQKNGNIWTRRFEHLEVILDVGNGTAEYRKVKVSPNLEGKSTTTYDVSQEGNDSNNGKIADPNYISPMRNAE